MTGTGKSNLGDLSFQSINEPDFRGFPPPPSMCPNGEMGFSIGIVQGSAVYQVKSRSPLGLGLLGFPSDGAGDLFFTETSSATNCFPFSCFENSNLIKGCTFFVDTKANITGGMGKFAGATGSLELSGQARVLFVDPTGIFGGAASEGKGTINIP